MALAAIGGSAAFVAILGDNAEIAMGLALALAFGTALDLVFGFSPMARRHDDLYRRFSDLAADITTSSSPSEEEIRRWRERRLLIEKDEPTQIDALNVRCHNEEAEARGLGKEDTYYIRWYQVALSQLFTLPPYNFPPLASPNYREEPDVGEDKSNE